MKSPMTTLRRAAGIGALASSIAVTQAENAGDWASTLKSIGKVYSSDTGLIQEVKFFGRAHYQWNYSDGEAGGQDFNGNGDELRRFRFGSSVKFLNGFKALGRIDLEKGGFRQTQFGYANFDELFLEYSKKNVLGFDKVSAAYGRFKLAIGGEEHLSSKKIKTIERSGINNAFGGLRPTGLRLKASKDGIDYTAGVYSTQGSGESIGGWEGGTAFHAGIGFEALGGDVQLDFLHAQDSNDSGDVFGFDWVASAALTREVGRFDILTNAIFSDQGNGNLYGFVFLPSTYLIEDKLEAVFRYQYAKATGAAGVSRSSSSRGLRGVARNVGAPTTGSGDENHSVYAGLNYYLAGHYAKFMTGVEYETITGGGAARELDGTTLWAAFRMYF